MTTIAETSTKTAAQQIVEIASATLTDARRERTQLLERLRRVSKTIVDMEGQLIAAGVKAEEP